VSSVLSPWNPLLSWKSSLVCLSDDYIAIGADCEHIAAQIEEYILAVLGFLKGLHISRP